MCGWDEAGWGRAGHDRVGWDGRMEQEHRQRMEGQTDGWVEKIDMVK